MTESDDRQQPDPSDSVPGGDSAPEASSSEVPTPEAPAPETPPAEPSAFDPPRYGDPRFEQAADQDPQYGETQYGETQYGTTQYGAPQYRTPQYGAPQYGAPQYGAGPDYGAAPYPDAFGAAPGAPTVVVPKPPSLGDGLKWAWQRYSANAGVIIGAALVWALLFIVVAFVLSLIVGAAIFAITGTDTSDTVSAGASVAVTAVMTIVILLAGSVALSCWLNGIITIADGRRSEFGDFFRVRALGPILAISVILGIISAVAEVAFNYGLGLPWVSTLVSIVIGLLTMWMVYLAADQLTGVGSAMSGGLALSTENFGSTVVVYLMSILLSVVGFLLLLVGLLVTLPLSSLLMLYYLRSLTQRPIVADTVPGY